MLGQPLDTFFQSTIVQGPCDEEVPLKRNIEVPSDNLRGVAWSER